MDLTVIDTVLGSAVALLSIYLAYLTVPPERLPSWLRDGRKTDHLPEAPKPDRRTTQGPLVFISHVATDEPAADRLARTLTSEGLGVFLARWVEPGLVPLLEADRALRHASHGVLLFSEATQRDRRVMDDYAAALQRVHEGGCRLIPVLLGQVRDEDLPPFVRIRMPLDLRQQDDKTIKRAVRELVAVIRRDVDGTSVQTEQGHTDRPH